MLSHVNRHLESLLHQLSADVTSDLIFVLQRVVSEHLGVIKNQATVFAFERQLLMPVVEVILKVPLRAANFVANFTRKLSPWRQVSVSFMTASVTVASERLLAKRAFEDIVLVFSRFFDISIGFLQIMDSKRRNRNIVAF